MKLSPCDWPLFDMDAGDGDEDDEGCSECPALEELPEEKRKAVEGMAVDLLWNWTGRKFGLCETEVYPCRGERPKRPPTFWENPILGGWQPVLIEGRWEDLACGICRDRCSCGPDRSKALRLPGPTHEVTEVWLGGELVDGDDYKVVDGVLLLSGGHTFPDKNVLGGDVEDAESGAWKIVYERGYAVPVGGQLAAFRLACELAKAIQNQPCDLPQRVQSVTRQGVTMAILDDFQDLEEGRVGIWEIDAWVAAVNAPRNPKPTVWSPDMPLGGQRGTSRGLARGSYFG